MTISLSIRCILGDIRLWVGDTSTSSCRVCPHRCKIWAHATKHCVGWGRLPAPTPRRDQFPLQNLRTRNGLITCRVAARPHPEAGPPAPRRARGGPAQNIFNSNEIGERGRPCPLSSGCPPLRVVHLGRSTCLRVVHLGRSTCLRVIHLGRSTCLRLSAPTPQADPRDLPRTYTLHSEPHPLHPTPYTLHPTPYNLTRYTLHPTPYTPHTTPSIPNPKSRALNPPAPFLFV